MAEEEGLELKIKSSLDQTTSILDKVKKSLNDTGIQIQSISHTLDDQSKYLVKAKGEWANYVLEVNKAGNVKLKSVSQDYAGKLRDEQKAIRQQTLDANEQTRNLNQAIGVITARAYLAARMIKQVAGGLKTCATQAIDFNETVNKFNVAMGSSVDRATEFQDKLAEAFGTSRQEMMDYQATFKNIMSTTAGLTEDTAEKVSESLVKMGLDYSSLFNVDQKSAMEKYQGALTGSIRPIRNGAGYDVSKNAIMSTAKDLGIDRTYNDLNEMERRLLRIITLMDQMRNTGAMQDLARTIEQPANQLKVLQNQLQEVQVWLGNVFIGTLGNILPYINGFVMAIKELIKTFAIFVGYRDNSSKLPDVFEQTRTATGGISKNLGSAAKSTKSAAKAAKEFRKQLMGFDVLNVINKPTPSANTGGGGVSGGGGGGGSVGAIDPKILNALKDYDNMMDQITMKATKIRDKILDWLGATDGSYKNLKRIVIIAGTILGILKLIKTIGAIANLITVMKGGVPIASNFAAGLKTIAGGVKGAGTAITKAGGGFAGFLKVLKGIIPVVLKFVGVVGGIALAIGGSIATFKLYNQEMETGKKNMGGLIASGTAIIGGGALIGTAILPGIGTAIGALVGAIAVLIENIIGANKVMQNTIDNDLFGSITISTEEWKKSLEELDPEMQDFDSKLSDYTDSMQSYYDSFSQAEDTIDRYATKFSLASYKISDEDIKNMGDAIEQFSTNATGTVEATTDRMIDLWSQTYKSNDGTIDEGERSMLSKIQSYGDDQKQTIKDAQDLITQTYQNGISERGYLTEDERKTIENALSQIQDLVKNNMSTSETNMQYYVDDTKKKTSQAGADVLNITEDSYENFKKAQKEYLDEQEKNRTEKYNEQINNLNAMHTAGKISEQEYNDALTKINDERAKGEDETNQKVTEYRDQLFSGLYRKYIELESDTSSTAKKERKEIEDMFKNANIDTSYVESQVWNKGERVGSTFKDQVQTNSHVDLGDSVTVSTMNAHNAGKQLGIEASNAIKEYFNIGKLHFTSDGPKWYATGGLPETGSLFYAGEAGPELVSRIGGQTTVMNMNQMTQSVATAFANTMSSWLRNVNVGGGSFNVYLDGDQLSATVQRRNEIYNNMTGR